MTEPEYEGSPAQIDILPDELMITIFKLLPLESILNCEKVCSRWKKLARDPAIWRQIVIKYSIKDGESEINKKILGLIEEHADCVYCVKIQYVYHYPVIKSIIRQCPNLTSLEIVMCRVSKQFEQDIRRWPNLKKLNLKNTLVLHNEDLAIEYDNLKHLKSLELADCGLPVTTRHTLFSCKYLSHIYIDKVRNVDIEFVNNLIKSKMDILQALHLYGAHTVNDQSLHLLAQCKFIKDLAIVRCESLTDAGLVKLPNLNMIESLQIWNNVNFTEMNLRKVFASPALVKVKRLSLSKIENLSPSVVDVISEYKNLTFLALYQCPKIINTDYEKQLKSKFRNIDVVLY